MSLTLADGHKLGWQHFACGCDRERGPFIDRKARHSKRMRAVRRAWLEGWDDAMNQFAELAANESNEVVKSDVADLYKPKAEMRPL